MPPADADATGHPAGDVPPTQEPQQRAHKRTMAELAALRKLVAREAHEAERARGDHLGSSRSWKATIIALLLLGAALRLYGIKQGLPFAYNVDEQAHFLPRAIGMFGHGGNPD
ncbi:MAG: hypothetical protein QM679_05205, partial [Patulibacter sp.]